MLRKLIGAALLAALAPVAFGATFNVTTPAEFQTALTTAQANNEADTINVAEGFYNIAASGTLTYTAVAAENFPLSIFGQDSTLVTLDGGASTQILRIDTTAVVDDSAVFIEVWNMTFENGNATGVNGNGGALAIVTDESQQPPQFVAAIGVFGSEFYGNAADGDGGAIYIRGHGNDAGIVLDDLSIDGNQAGGDGGGAYVAGGLFTTDVDIINIDFWNNTAQGSGGGLTVEGFDAATPTEDRAQSVFLGDILFYNNQSTSISGGGGGADVSAGNVQLSLVGFVDNSAATGGGLRIRDNSSNLLMTNTGFIGNSAANNGGGMAAGPMGFGSVTVTNNTVYQNTATGNGGGLFVEVDGSTTFADFYNNILYDNTSLEGLGDDLFVNNQAFNDIPATVSIFNNLITVFEVQPGPAGNDFNLNQAPVFVDSAARPEPDPRLVLDSPGIDAGDNDAPGVPSFDFELEARPLDGNGDTLAVVDIGMDEFSGAPALNADLSVLVVDNPDIVTGGEDITYTVTVTNNGPGDATNVQMVDTLNVGLTFVSATPTQGTCSFAAPTVSCDLGSLANGATATITIVATTPEVTEPVNINNQAGVSATEPDPVSGNDTASQPSTIVPAGPAFADLALTKGDAPDPVFSGGPSLTYTLTVTNNGPADASGVALTDTLPDGVTFDLVTPGDPTCSEANGIVSCDLGALAVDASTSVTIVVTPDQVTEPTDITNIASVTGTEEDPSPANNSAAQTTTVNPPSSDVEVTTTSTPEEPLINEQITYDITVTNDGPSNNSGTVLTVTLPPQATFGSVTVDQGTCDVDGGTVTCTIGDLAAGVSVTAQIIVTAPGEAVTLTLSATVSADVDDPTPNNNAVSQQVVVIDVIDLVIEGESEGSTGSIGWLELALLVAAAGVVAVRCRRVAVVPVLAVLATGVIAGTPVSAVAQEGWYVGAAVGRAGLDYDESDLTRDLANLGWTIRSPSVDDSDTAFKVYAGFQFNEWFALEAGYADLGEVETRYATTIPPTEINAILTDTLSIHPYQGDGWIAAAVVKWPFADDRFAVAGRAGLFAWESETEVEVVSGGTGRVSGDDSGTDAMFGIGIEWRLNDRWMLTADWERYQLNEWLDVPSVGVRFSF